MYLIKETSNIKLEKPKMQIRATSKKSRKKSKPIYIDNSKPIFSSFVFDRLLPRLTDIFSIFNHILNVIHLLLLSP
jgi:hypothetical protein